MVRVTLLLCVAFLLVDQVIANELARNDRGVIATGHPLASAAGVAALKQGGNAIDAAVAAALTLGVVDGHNSGIGGGCFMLIRLVDGECVAIDGRETAPAAAHRDMFVRNGKADTALSQIGALAAGTPGALAAYDEAIKRYGKLSLKAHLLAAAALAEHGFPIDETYARRSKATAEELELFESSRAVFLAGDGKPLAEGETLKQPDLAQTYRCIAEQGTAWFYGGPFAESTATWMAEHDGLLSVADFKNYRPRIRTPVRTTYREFEVIGFPPPSSGGVHVLQLLSILEQFDLRAMEHNSPDMIHTIAEAMKLAFADRAFWLGDPDFVPVPRGLISKEYAQELAGRIHPAKATAVLQHAVPLAASDDLFEKHTTHLSAADAEGNWVACTATINTAFGSKVVVPGTGVLLNNEMDDFAIQPGVPNAFNLIGGEANAVAPGKRPLSSMSPTIVLRDGQPILAVGAAGGPTIISQTLLAIINTVDFGLSVREAIASARFHHQWKPDELKIERAIAPEVRDELRKRGHILSETDSFGACQAVAREEGAFVGAADPRNSGTALGW